MENYLEKLFSNIVISAFLPAFTFVCTTYFLFYDLVPVALKSKAKLLIDDPIYWIIGVSVVIGFVMLYGKDLVLSIYRGLYLPKRLKNREKGIAEKLWKEICKSENKMSQETQKSSDKYQTEDIRRRSNAIAYCSDFPPDLSQIAVTRLGNIWRAMEYYPADRYGIESVAIWHRLRQVIPSDNLKQIDEAYNQLLFFVNLSFFSYMICILSFSAAIHYAWHPFFLADCSFTSTGCAEKLLLYFTAFVLSLLLGMIFYKMSLPIARYYANTHKSAFDLFRFLLLENLKQEKPSNINEEIDTWETLSELVDIGIKGYLTRNDGQPLNIPYCHTNQHSKPQPETERFD